MRKMLMNTLQLTAAALAVGQAYAQTPATDAKDANDNTVVVSGIRASARSALAVKKDTMEVVDSISAEDIGKLPDPNVAETLTRIPGVQGYRYGGEGASPVGQGSGLTIRGLSGQTASQVNGRAYFTAGSREYNVEGAIPGMVAGIDVYKNPSAEHVEGAIGGLVNIRTRKPSDFKEFTATLSVNGRENDLAKKKDPELFGLIANKWDLGGGSRIGLMAAGVYQKSTGRSDNNPANGGANFKRAVRADSAEYASLAAANTSNNPALPMSAYVGRTDINYLASVPTVASAGAYTPDLTGLTAAQAANVMVAPGLTSNVFQETIYRTRKGLSLAADYRQSNTLRFYTEGEYTYYRYYQNYRGLNSVDGGNVQNLQTTPFNFTEGLANRNLSGGSDDVLVNKRLLSGTFLNSTVNTIGGEERRPYTTWIAAGGVEWSPNAFWSLKADLSYIKADQTQDNRSVNMDSANGLYWSTTRVADGAPHSLTFSGPSLSDPSNFVFRDYSNGTYQKWDDNGYAAKLDAAYSPEEGFFNKIKFGGRAAHQKSLYTNFSFSGKALTSDGATLTANRSNGINASTLSGVLETAPSNFMNGDAGYSGGYVVYSPAALDGNQVQALFPNAGIPSVGNYAENLLSRRVFNEHTLAGYVQGEFATADERLRGNVGVRLVRTDTDVTARVASTTSGSTVVVDNLKSTSYTYALPSFNLTYDIQKDFLARFGYGRGMTRPEISALNPSITVNTVSGTGTAGNADLRPQLANSFDLSLERYFNATNYVSVGFFDKEIKGFLSGIVECQTVPLVPAYSGSTANSCPTGQYQITKSVNAEKGYARGVELAGQYFFDGHYGWLKDFGVSGSYTYVDTSNPINIGTATARRVIDSQQPFVSKNSFSLAGMYEAKRMSARLVYTWRSEQVLFGVSANPIDGRYIESYGILDGSFNYDLMENLTLSLTASNLTNKALNRYVGEPGAYATDIERQHYVNGRTYSVGLRYKFGK
ncbi:TonB-dependent receptor [Duganella sp. FT80W]|uniref:TonB-dependent receptor n=1 Tax=Duganella guangzhouensis TaxID=2666084 RepID=A0A6I2L0E5_9BURK|nr:TonB-dependent receptor [Duganella guangzhouensis]MRW89749.1 TonB-dependent receptor [Duganella guangzhouensis]